MTDQQDSPLGPMAGPWTGLIREGRFGKPIYRLVLTAAQGQDDPAFKGELSISAVKPGQDPFNILPAGKMSRSNGVIAAQANVQKGQLRMSFNVSGFQPMNFNADPSNNHQRIIGEVSVDGLDHNEKKPIMFELDRGMI